MDRLKLITQNVDEVITSEEVKALLDSDTSLRHYIGFEISGLVHLGNGIMSALKIRDLQQAGVECTIFLADWHAWINEKLDGQLETIKRIGVGYFKEAMRVSLQAVGAESDKVKFVLGSELYEQEPEYWRTVIEVAKHTTLARAQRSIDILGRKEAEGVDFAKLIYPIMQVADIFQLGVNIAHAGTDQRKAHVIARDVGLQIKAHYKPVAIHHHLLLGLGKPSFAKALEGAAVIAPEELRQLKVDMKMSKSKPDSCIFIHDSAEDIKRKLQKAFCAPKEIKYNPVLDWASYLILPWQGSLEIETGQGLKKYSEQKILEADYEQGMIHPMDLKTAVTACLQEKLKPLAEHFNHGQPKQLLDELVIIKNN